MRFRLQHLNAHGPVGESQRRRQLGLRAVGAGEDARQYGGCSFSNRRPEPAVTLRGVVDYQWRRGTAILSRPSGSATAGHKSLAGADPAGYSAAAALTGSC